MKRAMNTGLSYVRRAPYQAFAVIFVMSVTFFVTTLVSLLVFGSTRLLSYFETRPQIIAFLKTDSTDAQVAGLRSKYENDPRVKEIKLVSKEDAFKLYKNATASNPLLGELVSPSIFPASFEFSVTDLAYANDMVTELQKSEAVESVGFTASVGGQGQLTSVITRLRTITNSVRVAGVVSISVLLVTSFLVLLVVMSMRISMRKTEIESLSLLGATGSFIRNPILVEASLYSVLGVFAGWFGASLIVLYGSPKLLSWFGSVELLPHSLPELLGLLGVIFAIELFVGIVIGIIGAFAAVSRSLRMVQ